MKDIRQKLLATFQVEHKEHLKCIRDILSNAQGALSPSDLDEVFRRAHSLKGASRAVDLRPIESLAHRVETLFSRVRTGSLAFDSHVAEVVGRALNASEDFLAALAQNQTPDTPVNAIDAIEKLLGTSQQPALVEQPSTPQVDTPTPRTAPPVFQPLETVRVLAKNLDRLVSSAGQLSAENLQQDLLAQKLRGLDRHVEEALTERVRARRAAAAAFRKLENNEELSAVSSYIEYLESHANLISTEIQSTRQIHDRNSWTLKSLTTELQTEVSHARMIPAENVFESFPKMIRDLARDEGKTVELQVAGSQVHADRLVLQALKDPVMHLLRNALSHGIEANEERSRKRKTEPSRIRLKIETEGNRLHVIVEDNGRGLDLARILEIAVRRGLTSQTDASSLSAAEVARFIFLPGFSTSRSVSEVSGRGMGLSVVAEAVALLQGKVEIHPLDVGVRFTISVPLSISSHRLLLVSSHDQTFAIPLHGIERLYRIPLKDVETVEGKPVVRVHGRHVSLASLAHMLGLHESGVHAEKDTLNVAILRLGERRLAVAVDSFLAEREAVIKDLPHIVAGDVNLAGGILLEDGTVCLVLNSAKLIGSFQQAANSLVIKNTPNGSPQKKSRILIVDDSMTTRTLEKSILEAHGYMVAVAVDGIEALDCLRSEPVGLVVTDIEMPRMDGFGLLIEMKNDPRLAGIPVIIVSSLENREHQERGMALGADAYVVKRRFEQQELLDTIQQIL